MKSISRLNIELKPVPLAVAGDEYRNFSVTVAIDGAIFHRYRVLVDADDLEHSLDSLLAEAGRALKSSLGLEVAA